MTRLLTLIVLTSTLLTAPAPRAQAANRPNVLFLFTDDQRADTIHALGNPVIQTPNLDRLVHAGLTFNNAYCQGGYSGAVCMPSRQSTLSGRTWFAVRNLPADAPNWPRSMNEAGYITYHHGKTSNSPHNYQDQCTLHHYLKDEADRTSGYPGKTIADDAVTFLADWKAGKHGDKPFFMHLAFANPHDPRIVIPEYLNKYSLDDFPLPKNFAPFHPFDNGELFVRDEKLAPWPRTQQEIRKQLRDYYGVITYLDMSIGRILDQLKAVGADENTLVIFSTDQGLALGSHGLMGKQNVYEDGMGRVPLIFAGPGIAKDKRTDAFVYLMDIFPTVVDYVGGNVPAGLDGRSFAPVLRGQSDKSRDAIFLAYKDLQRAVRVGDWKLIVYPPINRVQLFNISADPYEINDLSKSPGQAPRIAQLMTTMQEQQKLFGDTAPLKVDNPKPADITLDFFAHPPPEPAKKKKNAKKN